MMMRKCHFSLIMLILFRLNLSAQPKNIIVMIGDGMGYEQMNMSLYWQGKAEQNIWHSFPVKLAAATYDANGSYDPTQAWSSIDYVKQSYTESSAAATAIATGHRTSANHVGLSKHTIPITNPVQIATTTSRSSGIVTSVPFNHATPAGFVAHNKSRNSYGELALNIILHSSATVVMGCGHPFRDNSGNTTLQGNFKYLYSEEIWIYLKENRTKYIIDSNSFIVQDIDGDKQADAWNFSDDRNYLTEIISGKEQPKRLFFLAPAFETLIQMREGESKIPFDAPVNKNIPSLSEMSLAALTILSANQVGFFLMIEGGAIDWAGHDNSLPRTIEEQMEFEKTVETVIQWVTEKNLWMETLLIVVADHECGYLTGGIDESNHMKHISNQGEGILPNYSFLSDSHTNHLVPFFAKGADAHVFLLHATEYDPVRGNYLHISDIGNHIKYVWGNHAVAFPASVSVCPEHQFNVTATAPFDVCSYQWFDNGQIIDGAQSHTLQYKVNKDTNLWCELRCASKVFTTNTVIVHTNKCE